MYDEEARDRGHDEADARTRPEISTGHHRTHYADASEDTLGSSGWVTTEVAAKAIRVSPRTVRRMIDRGELRAKPEGEGVERRWLVDVDSLHVARSTRSVAEVVSASDRAIAEDADMPGKLGDTDREHLGTLADVIRDMSARVEERTAEAVELRVRLELTEKAQSTIEAERDRLLERVRELESAQELRELSETVAESPGKGDVYSEPPEPSRRRSWLYKFFFGPG